MMTHAVRLFTRLAAATGKLLLGAVAAGLAVAALGATPQDNRQLVTLPEASRATLREEMLANLRAVHQIGVLLATDKLAEAADLADSELGIAAMGRNRSLPLEARPGAHMPAAMHALGIDGHQAASHFAREARSGDRARALAAWPGLTTACVACHHAYRVR